MQPTRTAARPSEAGEGAEAICVATRRQVGTAHRELLRHVPEWEAAEIWVDYGCRDLEEWLAGHLGVTFWFAARVIKSAQAIAALPRIANALQSGVLSLDKVVELTRFATPRDEARLVTWARRVSAATIRAKGDAAAAVDPEPALEADRARYLTCSWSEHGLYLEGVFGPDQGRVVADCLDRLALKVPDIVAEDDGFEVHPGVALDMRRADALYALCAVGASAGDVERTTLVVHADAAALGSGELGAELVGGPVISADVRRRLSCDGRLEVVAHGRDGHAVGIGHASRVVPPWLLRQLRHRDGGRCTFPACRARTWLEAHHVWHWEQGGRTDLDNLTLVCRFHHKLVHDYRWSIKLGSPGVTHWYRPDGREYDSGPPVQDELFAEIPSDFNRADVGGSNDLVTDAPTGAERGPPVSAEF